MLEAHPAGEREVREQARVVRSGVDRVAASLDRLIGNGRVSRPLEICPQRKRQVGLPARHVRSGFHGTAVHCDGLGQVGRGSGHVVALVEGTAEVAQLQGELRAVAFQFQSPAGQADGLVDRVLIAGVLPRAASSNAFTAAGKSSSSRDCRALASNVFPRLLR